MDVLLLGAAAIVLLVLTIWIVWRPGTSDAASDTREAPPMLPQGDEFEDQYTSATADLSAAGVAVGAAAAQAEAAQLDAAQSELEAVPSAPAAEVPVTTPPWPADTIRTEGSATGFEPIRRTAADDVRPQTFTPMRIGLGAAALLALGGAIAGAWLYARIQRERNKPLNRLRRRFR